MLYMKSAIYTKTPFTLGMCMRSGQSDMNQISPKMHTNPGVNVAKMHLSWDLSNHIIRWVWDTSWDAFDPH